MVTVGKGDLYSHTSSPAALDAAVSLAGERSVGGFIDRTMALLCSKVRGELVSFNEISLYQGTVTVSLRPYRDDHPALVQSLNQVLREHPMFLWYMSQPDWSPVRLSDLVDQETLVTSRVYREVLVKVGGQYAMLLAVTPPTSEHWLYFMANRQSSDFSDSELNFARMLHPALIALYASLSGASVDKQVRSQVTHRELLVLRHLAAGYTAKHIGHELGISQRTVHKHLENLYRKLGTSDRLGAVLKGRGIGLLREDELSPEFEWQVYL